MNTYPHFELATLGHLHATFRHECTNKCSLLTQDQFNECMQNTFTPLGAPVERR